MDPNETGGEEGENIGMTNLGTDDTTDTEQVGQQQETIFDDGTPLTSKRMMGISQLEELEGDDLAENMMNRWGIDRINDIRLAEILEKEKVVVMDKVIGFEPKEAYGPKNKELMMKTKVRLGKMILGDNVNGVSFEGKNVIVTDSKRDKYEEKAYKKSESKSKGIQGSVLKFSDLVKEAKKEYEEQSLRHDTEKVNEGASTSADDDAQDDAVVDEEKLVTDVVMDEVTKRLLERMKDLIDAEKADVENLARGMGMNEPRIRETITGTSANLLEQKLVGPDSAKLKYAEVEKILKANTTHWEKEIQKTDSVEEKEVYAKALSTSELVKDYFRVSDGLKPESEEGKRLHKEVVGGSDWLRYERFKKWAKENLLGLSTGAITVAAFITSIVAAARDAIKVAAKGIGRFAKAVANVLKKMGPIFSALGDIVSTALSFGAKGVEFLASNLWILAIAVAYALYNGYISRRNTPSPQIQYQNYPETQQTGPRRRVRNRVENYT